MDVTFVPARQTPHHSGRGAALNPPVVKLWIVWCYERCHKEENLARRHWLMQAARNVGAKLLCFKKAKQFEHWVDQTEHRRFILLTDWREAQPCIACLEQKETVKRPSLTLGPKMGFCPRQRPW